ncbi:glycoside hydrolase [Dentipellis sp. KUC8613]|nr:glycoside hydrolase [Dentipellis sp. KUC8613]
MVFSHGFGMLALFTVALGFMHSALAFNITKNDNLAVYWGQDSAGNQQDLSTYCADDTIDNVILAFLYIFEGTGGEPVIDFANTCNQWDDPVFPGTALANCGFMASQIEACQAKGKIVTLSLGGATGQVGFSSDATAKSFADTIWNMFLGGSSSTRPFGSAVLDGVDLDIESGSPSHYAAFVNQIRSHASGKSKKYYVTAAPQCPFPDANIGAALNAAPFDAVFVQFYNNYCGLDQPDDYNFDTWDNWARTQSSNKNIKVFIGAAASSNAAGEGYVGISTLENYATDAQDQFKSFGGVMLWDASEAWTNNRYDKAIKNAMTSHAATLAAKKGGSSKSTPSPVDDASQSDPKAAMWAEEEAGIKPEEKPHVKSRFFRN